MYHIIYSTSLLMATNSFGLMYFSEPIPSFITITVNNRTLSLKVCVLMWMLYIIPTSGQYKTYSIAMCVQLFAGLHHLISHLTCAMAWRGWLYCMSRLHCKLLPASYRAKLVWLMINMYAYMIFHRIGFSRPPHGSLPHLQREPLCTGFSKS